MKKKTKFLLQRREILVRLPLTGQQVSSLKSKHSTPRTQSPSSLSKLVSPHFLLLKSHILGVETYLFFWFKKNLTPWGPGPFSTLSTSLSISSTIMLLVSVSTYETPNKSLPSTISHSNIAISCFLLLALPSFSSLWSAIPNTTQSPDYDSYSKLTCLLTPGKPTFLQYLLSTLLTGTTPFPDTFFASLY